MATAVLPRFAGQRLATEMYINDLSMDALYMTASGLVDDILVDSQEARAHAGVLAGAGAPPINANRTG